MDNQIDNIKDEFYTIKDTTVIETKQFGSFKIKFYTFCAVNHNAFPILFSLIRSREL